MPDKPSSAADRYVAELAGKGHPGASSAFTLDRTLALEKLRSFQLPDPSFYVLLLVQAAVRQGAERIDITTGRGRLTLAYDAPPLSHHDLETLYDAALQSGATDEDDLRGVRRALGIGISTARQRVQQIVLRSVGTHDGAQLQASSDASYEVQPCADRSEGEPGRTTVELALQQRWARPDPEVRVLRQRCRYAATDIFMDGERISRGPVLERMLAAVPIQRGRLRGTAGFDPLGTGDRALKILRHGVLLKEEPIADMDQRFVAVVDAPDLQTDLSSFDVVQDHRYTELVRTVRHAHRRTHKEHNVKSLCSAWNETQAEQRVSTLVKQRHSRRRRLHAAVALACAIVVVGILTGLYLAAPYIDSAWQLGFAVLMGLGVAFPLWQGLYHHLWNRWVLLPLARRYVALFPAGSRLERLARDRADWLRKRAFKSGVEMAREAADDQLGHA